jgi:hypothetical protein
MLNLYLHYTLRIRQTACTLLLSLGFFSSSKTIAQILPTEYLYDWHLAGSRNWDTNLVHTIPFETLGGIGDGLTLNDSFLNNLPNIKPLRIVLDTGTFLFKGPILLPDSIILEGKGTQTCIAFVPENNNNLFVVQGNTAGEFRPLSLIPQRNDKKMVLSNMDGFAVGKYAEISQENGSWDSNPASWAQNSVGHISKIIAIHGDTLWLEEGLRFTPDSLLNPQARPLNMKTGVHFNCFRIERRETGQTAPSQHFLFRFAADCSVTGIESFKSMGSHILVDQSAHLSFRNNYIHDAWIFDGSGTRGYGITLNNHSVLCLIENNRFRRLRHAMSVKHGANGNVIGYNFSSETNRSEPINDYSADINLHGHYPFANLIEGNEVEMIMIDHYWGPSGPNNLFFRNRVTQYGIFITAGTPVSNQQHFIGNVTTNSSLFKGLFSLQGSGHFLFGNQILGNAQPPGTTQLTDSSYYLTSLPSFWQLGYPWPAHGYPNPPNAYQCPAAWRTNQSIGAICNDSAGMPPPLTQSVHSHNPNLSLPWPNPCEASLSLPNHWKQWSLSDLAGKTIVSGSTPQYPQMQNLPSGCYLLKGGYHETHKIIKP